VKIYSGENIRNVALVGHGHAGKTTLASAMLFTAGAAPRLGRVDDGSAVTDYDDEEIARKMSISVGAAVVEWGKAKINILDTPGFNMFVHEAKMVLPVVDAAIVVVDGVAGVEVVTQRVWNYCEEYKTPRLIVVNRMDRDRANAERVLESLIKSGAMDSLGRRAQLMEVLDKAMDRAQKAQRDAESGQHGLFGVFQQDDAEAGNEKLPNVPDWDEHTRLTAEKEILGFFISGHPLEKYKDKLQDLQALSTADLAGWKNSTGKDETIAIAGIIANVRVLKSKRGDFYAQATLEDMSGTIDMIVFPEAYKRIGDKVKLEVPVLVKAGVRIEEGTNPKITAAEIMPLARTAIAGKR